MERGKMHLRMEHLAGVDNLRNYPVEMIEELKGLLLSGAPASPDAKREGFYDLDGRGRKFFIHISPATRRVALLATWLHPEREFEHAGCVEGGAPCAALG
jgi:hypothetical protein